MSEQAEKLNRIIAKLWDAGHLKALNPTEEFEASWDDTANLIIMNWAIETDEDILLDDALEMAMNCNAYEMIAKKHDDDLGLSNEPWDVEKR